MPTLIWGHPARSEAGGFLGTEWSRFQEALTPRSEHGNRVSVQFRSSPQRSTLISYDGESRAGALVEVVDCAV